METKAKIIVLTLAAIGVLYVAARLTDVFNYYTVPTPANRPNMPPNSLIFASNLLTPKKNDFVCYYPPHRTEQKVVYVMRMVAEAGDTVETKKGILYVNGKNADEGLNLAYAYKVAKPEYKRLSKLKLFTKSEEKYTDSWNDSVIIYLSQKEIEEHKIVGTRTSINTREIDADNFGPKVVPPDHFFVLGDSRNNSYDSRFYGAIPKENYVTTVFGILKLPEF